MIPTRSQHPFLMHDELMLAPEAIERYLHADEVVQAQRSALAARIAAARRVWLTGCGTAYHAALAGRSLLDDLSKGALDARAVEAFELAHYEHNFSGPADMLVALSHSGRPTATNDALTRANSTGAYCVTITGFSGSPAALAADAVLDTGYSAAQSMAYTISYSLMLVALADLATRATEAMPNMRPSGYAASLAGIASMHRTALATSDAVHQIAHALAHQRRWIFAGGGPNYATALEAALKMQETNYSASIGLQVEEVLHGPIATLGESILVLLAPPGSTRERALELIKSAHLVGTQAVVIGEQGDDILTAGDFSIALPAVPEALSPLLYHIPVHLLSYWLAVETDANPDVMRRDNAAYLAARQSYTL